MNKDDLTIYIKLAYMAGLVTGLLVAYFLMRRVEQQIQGQWVDYQKKCPGCTASISSSLKRCPECFVELEGR